MAWKSVQQAQQNYTNRVAQSGPAYSQGVSNPQADWLGGFSRNQQKMIAGLQAAIANGTILAGAQRAGNQKWQNNARTKGATNYQAAAATAGPTYAAAMQTQFNLMQQAWSQVQNMPSDTRAARIARQNAYINEYATLNDQRKATG